MIKEISKKEWRYYAPKIVQKLFEEVEATRDQYSRWMIYKKIHLLEAAIDWTENSLEYYIRLHSIERRNLFILYQLSNIFNGRITPTAKNIIYRKATTTNENPPTGPQLDLHIKELLHEENENKVEEICALLNPARTIEEYKQLLVFLELF